MWVSAGLEIFAAVTALVGIAMLRNTGTSDNRLFWKTFGITLIVLACPLVYLGLTQ